MNLLRISAQIISVIFHPLIILTYMMLLLLLINPYALGVRTVSEGSIYVVQVFMSSFLIPAFATFMLRLLGFVDSFELRDKQERIGPYIISGTFYLVLFLFFYRNHTIPNSVSTLFLGAVIAIFIAFFINNFQKVSAHTVGMGGLVGMMIVTMKLTGYASFGIQVGDGDIWTVQLSTVLIVCIILAGLVGTARLILGAHSQKEIYLGYLVGLVGQLIAYIFLV